jgi:DNA repair protein RadC
MNYFEQERDMFYEIVSTRKIRKVVKANHPQKIFEALKRYANLKQEYFLVVSLNSSMEMIAVHIVSIGTVSETLVHPREIFRKVILDCATFIAIAHNHPSGKAIPSSDDLEITAHIKCVADILQIYLVDSLIITKTEYFSFREHDMLKNHRVKYQIINENKH